MDRSILCPAHPPPGRGRDSGTRYCPGGGDSAYDFAPGAGTVAIFSSKNTIYIVNTIEKAKKISLRGPGGGDSGTKKCPGGRDSGIFKVPRPGESPPCPGGGVRGKELNDP